MKHLPFSWIKKIKEATPEAFEIPLFGNAASFDWHHFSTLLAKQFESHQFSLRPLKQEWLTKDEIAHEKTYQSSLFGVLCLPLNSLFYFFLPKADRNKLTAWMMQSKTKGQISEALKEGFCRFLALEAISLAQPLDPFSKLTLSLSERRELPEEEAFCIEVEFSIGETTAFGKLIFPKNFRQAWVSHFSQFSPPEISHEKAKTFECILGLECGSLTLSQEDWKATEVGDFLLLDRATFFPKEKGGHVLVKLKNIPLFQAKVTQTQMEVVEMEEDLNPNEMAPTEEENVSIENIPMYVTVELTRLKLTLDQLIHLQPGNTLKLPAHLEDGVSLTINGKKVGKAELLYLGESLGIRILEIGK